MDKRVKKIKDPIYGYIEVPVSYITGIIDTAPFQRLRRVIQTSYAPLYPGTVHNRFTHSIGVYHLGVIATNSISNCWKHIKNISVDVDRLVSVFRLSCLLHDVGHAPFSHTGEKYYLGVNNSYDELHKRLADLIGSDEIIKDSSKNPGKKAAPHEIMSAIIGLSNYSDIIGNLDDRDFFSRCITGYEYSASDIDSQVKNCFIGLLNSKVIDVDKLDYLLRDAYFSGHGTVNIDYQRLLSSITIVEIDDFDDINGLVNRYNELLYHKHKNRKLKVFKDHIYISEYAEDSRVIINKLKELSSVGVLQYTESIDYWLSTGSYKIDDPDKSKALRLMFSESRVALIYGAAGTGKSTMINHIANFWVNNDKMFLANTHPAVDNMRRKVSAGNCTYDTIAKFLAKGYYKTKCDILFIDECSTVSNSDMSRVLEKADFKLLVLVGDVYQIESIYFGNWFNIARKFVPSSSVFELTHPFRTENEELITVWNRVRNLDDSILEPMVKNDYVARLDESIFEHISDDEIILCLNYDGLYGINNINRFLQNNNPNKEIVWGIKTYKVGDPILFNEFNVFSPLIHNNSKGKIAGIQLLERSIKFDIELDASINEIDAMNYSFELLGKSKAGKPVISFEVNKHRSTDEDDDDSDSTIVPFQVAYAVSIHKAQGLEYDSVKVVITKEIEERISHNIFYTAITRAKKELKIYWSPETEKYVLERLEAKNQNKDAYLLAQLYQIEIIN